MPKVKFAEILAKVYCIEELTLAETNIIMPNTWPRDLLFYGKSLTKISIQIYSLDFNVEDLANFMSQKSKNIVKIQLCCDTRHDPDKEKVVEKLKQNLSKHFIQISPQIPDLPCLSIYDFKNSQTLSLIGKFVLKTFKNMLKPENLHFNNNNKVETMRISSFQCD
uniref:Uncharacterized protein n=1 Tax=Panagrolaimus sp. ES5 TaxID=591445 RepID=A0AC34GVN8_9BILA